MLCLSLLVIVVDNSILNVALPRSADGACTRRISQLQWMVDSYTLVFASLLLTAGTLGDRFGRRGALQFGMVVFGFGSLAVGVRGVADAPDLHPRAHGHRRRVHHAGDAVDHHQHVPARGARSRDLVLGRDRRRWYRARADQRRLAARALLLGLDLPREPADRDLRADRRHLPDPDVEGSRRAAKLDVVGRDACRSSD